VVELGHYSFVAMATSEGPANSSVLTTFLILPNLCLVE